MGEAFLDLLGIVAAPFMSPSHGRDDNDDDDGSSRVQTSDDSRVFFFASLVAGGSKGGGLDESPWSFDGPGTMWRTTNDDIH